MDFQTYIKPELLVLIPVLYLIGAAIKKSDISSKAIPFILGAISVVLCALYVLAESAALSDYREIMTAVFTAVTQGILIAGASVYADQLVKQATETKKDE